MFFLDFFGRDGTVKEGLELEEGIGEGVAIRVLRGVAALAVGVAALAVGVAALAVGIAALAVGVAAPAVGVAALAVGVAALAVGVAALAGGEGIASLALGESVANVKLGEGVAVWVTEGAAALMLGGADSGALTAHSRGSIGGFRVDGWW